MESRCFRKKMLFDGTICIGIQINLFESNLFYRIILGVWNMGLKLIYEVYPFILECSLMVLFV
jgi:hypothetical protein